MPDMRGDRTIATSVRSYNGVEAELEGMMEHRWGHRREVSRAVQLETRGGVIARGRITDVSISGAFLSTHLPISLYSYVQVQFAAMLHGKRTKLSVEGQVVRKESTGIGIEWCEFAPEAVRALMMVPPFRLTEPSSHFDEQHFDEQHFEEQPVTGRHTRIHHR